MKNNKPHSKPTIKNKNSKKKDKKKYKIRNWREYNQMLVNRGSIFFWIEQSAQENWHNTEKTGKAGAPKDYSDSSILTCLTIQAGFHLSLRAVEGFINSLFQLMRIDLVSPDYSTLSVRAEFLSVDIRAKTDFSHLDEPLHIAVDSSGAKVYGEGEWKVRQYGWCKRRTWRKFHLGIDEKTKRLKAVEVTGNDTADCEMLESLLKQIASRIDKVSADGAYDRRRCYAVLNKYGAAVNIPPRSNARIWQHGNTLAPPLIRDENLRRIREIGRKQWKIETGYHRRSIAENAIFRFKTIFSDRLSSRNFANQKTEIMLKCRILNQMAELGLPDSYVVA